MHDYFDDYGCMRCRRLDAVYRSNGMCTTCFQGIYRRLEQSAIRRMKERLPRRYGKEFMAKALLAQKLLRGFPRRLNTVSKNQAIKSAKVASPIATEF